MQFTYAHGIPTVERAMRQIVMAWSGDPDTNPIAKKWLTARIEETVTEGLAEIRGILTAEMSTLFDPEGVAIDWNEAVEKCIQLVEGTLA